MNYAVIFHSGDGGIPDGWPKRLRELGESNGPLEPGESLVTETELQAIKSSLQGQYDLWVAAQNGAAELEATVASIRYEAQRRIVELTGFQPDQWLQWIPKQINMASKALRCVRKEMKGTATVEDVAFLDQLESFFDKVEAIRAYSNELESQWASGQRPDIYSGWPY